MDIEGIWTEKRGEGYESTHQFSTQRIADHGSWQVREHHKKHSDERIQTRGAKYVTGVEDMLGKSRQGIKQARRRNPIDQRKHVQMCCADGWAAWDTKHENTRNVKVNIGWAHFRTARGRQGKDSDYWKRNSNRHHIKKKQKMKSDTWSRKLKSGIRGGIRSQERTCQRKLKEKWEKPDGWQRDWGRRARQTRQ